VYPLRKHVILSDPGSSLFMVSVKAEGYTRVASTDEVPPGVTRKVDLNGKDLLLANVDGNYYAIGDVCTHEEGPLDEGILHHYEIECPWQGPAVTPEPSYDVLIEGKNILVRAK
jgi:phenylpropionate dioxygenase-like ring-hydroxylating dioxygenase large terminal subunit